MANTASASPFGALLRGWRSRRHLSQLELATEAGISSRHLSFIETGRSQPSREMVIHLAEHLEIPLRERNALLVAAGFAPVYGQTPLDAPEMQPVREALRAILKGYEPFPAAAVDRKWNLVDANAGIALFVEGVAPELLAPPMNVLRASLHPDGMAKRIINFDEWSSHVLTRLARQVALTGDAELEALLEELRGYPGVPRRPVFAEIEGAEKVFVPLRLRSGAGADERELRFLSTVSAFGTALDITVAELAVEAFLPADPGTVAALSGREQSERPVE